MAGNDQTRQKRRIRSVAIQNARLSQKLHAISSKYQELRQFNNRLLDQAIESEKLAELGRLSAGIAHEINNPLSIIAYAVQLLMREDPISPGQRELLERIDNETERLKTLTGGLLSFSRARETLKRFVDLNEIVHDVLRLVKFELSRHQVEIQTQLAPLSLVQVDPNKIKQVVINLVMNAIEAMKEGGTLSITTRLEQGQAILQITDDGPGIEPHLQDKIFEPFFTTRAEGEGTGLGLYICRMIIDDHDGQLQLESTVGQGATFRVLLPQVVVPEKWANDPSSAD